MKNRDSKEKARDLHIIRRAALHFVFPTCYVCGIANDGREFTLTTKSGHVRNMRGLDVQTDYCHLDARSNGGEWSESNLTVGHHYCNLAQREDSIEFFADSYQTVLTAGEIRTKANEAKQMADDMITGKIFYPAIAKIALDMIRAGKPHRTGKEWLNKLQAAA